VPLGASLGDLGRFWSLLPSATGLEATRPTNAAPTMYMRVLSCWAEGPVFNLVRSLESCPPEKRSVPPKETKEAKVISIVLPLWGGHRKGAQVRGERSWTVSGPPESFTKSEENTSTLVAKI